MTTVYADPRQVRDAHAVAQAAQQTLGVDAAIREMERCLKLGMRGVWLNTFPSVGQTIRPEDDAFWKAAEANNVAVHFHVRVMRQVQKPKPKGVRGDDLTGLATVGAASMIIDLPEIIQSGVHDRFPKLTWVAVETGSGWIPYILEQMDDRYWRNRSWSDLPITEPPSHYWYRNMSATYIVDRPGLVLRHTVGVDNMMWSTDYPHHGNDWPYSRKVIAETMGHIPVEEKALITGGNAARIWSID